MKINKKCWPEFFEAIQNGSKKFEVRLADFDCKPGDTLALEEWDPKTRQYTGRKTEKRVAYIFRTKNAKFWTKEEIEKNGLQIFSLE